MTAKAQVVIRSSVSPLRKEEVDAEDIKQMKRQFTSELNRRFEGKQSSSESNETFDTMDYAKYTIPIEDSSPSFTAYEDSEEEDFNLDDHNEEENQIEFDKYISSKVRLMEDNTEQIGVIKGRKRGPDGKFIGKFNENPILDTSIYEIEFQDGRVECYFANQIVECILSESEVEYQPSYQRFR